MSLDFGRANMRSVGAIACSLSAQLDEVLQAETAWQSGAIWLSGEAESGYAELVKLWATNNGAIVFDVGQTPYDFGVKFKKMAILEANQLEEQLLLSLLVAAETGEIQLLLAAQFQSNQFEVGSADLASRLRNLTNFQMPNMTKSIARQIISIALKEAGISQKSIDLSEIISKSNMNFVTISKLICFIVATVANNSKLSKSEIDEFINIQRNHDLFDDK